MSTNSPLKARLGKAGMGAGGAAIVVSLLLVSVPKHEKMVLKAYKDPVGIWTKCAGDTQDVTPGATYTLEYCRANLERRLGDHAEPVLACTPQIMDKPYMTAAAISLAYNIGTRAYCGSTAAKRFRARDFKAGCAAFSSWVYAKGRKLPGLVKRRADERALCEVDA